MNSKRIYRIYAEEKVIVYRRNRRRQIHLHARVLPAVASRANEIWTMDFLHDAPPSSFETDAEREGNPLRPPG